MGRSATHRLWDYAGAVCVLRRGRGGQSSSRGGSSTPALAWTPSRAHSSLVAPLPAPSRSFVVASLASLGGRAHPASGGIMACGCPSGEQRGARSGQRRRLLMTPSSPRKVAHVSCATIFRAVPAARVTALILGVPAGCAQPSLACCRRRRPPPRAVPLRFRLSLAPCPAIRLVCTPSHSRAPESPLDAVNGALQIIKLWDTRDDQRSAAAQRCAFTSVLSRRCCCSTRSSCCCCRLSRSYRPSRDPPLTTSCRGASVACSSAAVPSMAGASFDDDGARRDVAAGARRGARVRG